MNLDAPNPTPANSVFTTIGNPSGKLENGNVIRFSAWYRKDPQEPEILHHDAALAAAWRPGNRRGAIGRGYHWKVAIAAVGI